MPNYDPNFPPTNAPLISAQWRNQFHGIKDLIDAILTVTAAQVDGVNTLNPGDAANVSVSVVGNTLHFTFEIPRGNDGGEGPPGPAFAQAVIDAVNTGAPGSAAGVGVSFDGTLVHFTFDIPRGDKGDTGDPGEVTQAALDAAIAGTARNPSGQMGNLDPNWSPSGDTNADLLWLRDRLVELYSAEAR